MARDYAQTAKELVAALGVNENINNVTHCATRLRFILSDHKVVNKEKASKVQGVITTVEAGGQFQVVIGNHVKDAYEQVLHSRLRRGNSFHGRRARLYRSHARRETHRAYKPGPRAVLFL